MSKSEHVVISNENGGYKLECLHCKQTYIPAIPCPMDVFLAIMGSFRKSHKDCPKAKA